MFRRISLAYVALALAGVALLSAFTPEVGTVHLSELDGHIGEEVAVEALVVGAEGEEHVLWQDGSAVRAYAPSELRPGDVVEANALVLEGRDAYLQVDSWEVVGRIEVHGPADTGDGRWIACDGQVLDMNGTWAISSGPFLVPVELHFDADPFEGLSLSVEGIHHDGVLHVYDRDCLSSDRFMDAPWAVPGAVEVMGICEFEPRETSLTLRTLDGTIRVAAPEHGAHMGDLVEVRGHIDYDARNGRFSIVGDLTVIEVHGPHSPPADELMAEPWRYENARLTLVGNVTVTPHVTVLELAGLSLPLRGNLTAGFGQADGVLVRNGLEYVLDLDTAEGA